jgi:hypothetical protein
MLAKKGKVVGMPLGRTWRIVDVAGAGLGSREADVEGLVRPEVAGPTLMVCGLRNVKSPGMVGFKLRGSGRVS